VNILQKLFGQPALSATQPNKAVARPVPAASVPVVKPKAARKVATPKAAPRFQQPIVGESNYQEALGKICGRRSKEGEHRIVEARIIPDDKNKHDKNAVRIEIQGRVVGYIEGDDAPAYRARLKREGRAHATVACPAMIKGGWKRGKDVGHYGVWLDIAPL